MKDFSAVFSKNAMEFATVAREFCVFVESPAGYSKADYLRVASRILPLLYMKASMLPEVEPVMDDEPEEFVDYASYESVRIGIRQKLAGHDDYLSSVKEGAKMSETPIAASISEDLADVYQDVRNFCESYQSAMDEIMNDALALVSERFRSYWGQRLCDAQLAIHIALFSGDDLKDETPKSDGYEALDDDDEAGMIVDPDDVAAAQREAQQMAQGSMPYFLRQNGMNLTGRKN